MPDREYVIRCLKYLHDRETLKEGPLEGDDHAADRRRITADAIALLREQEPVEPKWIDYGDTLTGEKFEMPLCGNCESLISDALYCPRCGKKVKWDG